MMMAVKKKAVVKSPKAMVTTAAQAVGTGKLARKVAWGATAVTCLMLAPSVFAQHVSVGIKAGVPLTDMIEARGIGLPFSSQMKRYTHALQRNETLAPQH